MSATGPRFPVRAPPSTDQRVSPSPPSEVAKYTGAAAPMVTKSVERIEATSAPAPPPNRSTKGYCQNCHSYLGEYYNSWCRVTGSYYVPALRGSYRSLLKASGKQKAASRGTDLEGCTIQPVSCPALCSESAIGFVVVDAPSVKKHYRNRDFFKLGRIELRCEPSPLQSTVVEPLEDISKDLLETEVSYSSSPTPEPTDRASPMGGVEMSSLATQPGHQHTRHEPHRDLTHQRTAIQQGNTNKQPTLSNAAHSPQMSTVRSDSTLNVQSQQVGATPQLAQANHDARPHRLGSISGPLSVPVNGPLSALVTAGPTPSLDISRRHSPHEPRKTQQQQQQYPRPPSDVSLDAIQRLQTQISQNSGALAAHTRDIRRGEESFGYLEETLRREFTSQIAFQSGELQRVDSAVAKLHHEMQGIRQAIEGLRHELYSNRGERHLQQHGNAPPAQQISAQDSALELMAQQIAVTSHKANEVDTLKITIEIMKNKIQRLEDGGRQAPTPANALPSSLGNHGPGSTQQSPQVATHHSFTTPSAAPTPEVAQRIERVPSQSSGWTTINSGVKRTHGIDADNVYNGNVPAPVSTKRPRLATESTSSFANSTPQSHTMTPDSQSQFITHAQPISSQPPLSGSVASTPSQQPSHIPFGTQDGPSDDSWRPASQRDIEHRPRGRGRGGGPGSRGGRVRKSMPAQFHTPEWERDDWQGVPESQTGPDGFYNHAARVTYGIARRGTGGGGGVTRRGFTPTDRGASMSVGPAIGFESPSDSYDHGKKTRTKPIRNADGVLIRKDGRPDMRSQSSAANLRKVHARREGESEFSPAGTPTHASANVTETPSPTRGAALDTTNSKHNAIMGKMFPHGVDESRKEHDYTRGLFDKDHDHTVHPRARTAAKQASTIKKEQGDQHSITEIQISRGDEAGGAMNGGAGGEAGESPADGSDNRVIPETQMMDMT